MRRACEKLGIGTTTVINWLNGNEEFRAQYARAKRSLMELWAGDIVEISDNSSQDRFVDEYGKEKTDHEVVQRSRLRIDTRKWLMSKLAPKVYGGELDPDAAEGTTKDRPVVQFVFSDKPTSEK